MKKYIIFLLLFLSFLTITNAQQECPPTNEWLVRNTQFFRDKWSSTLEIWTNVNEKYKVNLDGSIDVKVDWSTLGGYNPFGLTVNELKGFMYMAIIKDLVLNNPCQPPATVDISFYEISECFVDVPCYLYANEQASVLCKDNLWPGPDPEVIIDSQNNKSLWVILNRQSFGYKCCKTTYTVTCIGTNEELTPKIVGTPQQTVFYGCPESNVYDCYFNIVKPCNGICPLIQDL